MRAPKPLSVFLALTIALTLAPMSIERSSYSIFSSLHAGQGRQTPFGPDVFADVTEKVKDAVVNISTTGGELNIPSLKRLPRKRFKEWSPRFEEFFERFFGEDPHRGLKKKSLGSGFIVDGEGYILTNHHVIAEAEEITVILKDGEEFKATVVGRDEETDIALIKIDAPHTLPTLSLGDSGSVRVGQWVVAIGNPFGLGHTVTVGVVSAMRRSLGRGPYDEYIQTDASINFGNSGGPLIDLQGRAIGINTAIYSKGQGLGFAIPINTAKDVLQELREKGTVVRGWLGVYIQNVTPELAESFGLPSPKGAIIARVLPDSPAQEGGLKRGDVIISFQGKEIEDINQFTRDIKKTRPGTIASFIIMREGETKDMEVRVGTKEEKEDEKVIAETEDEIGISLQELTPELAEKLGIEKGKGVLITKVKQGSKASQAGLRRGDVILEIDWKEVSEPEGVRKALQEGPRRERLLMLINRRGANRYLVVNR